MDKVIEKETPLFTKVILSKIDIEVRYTSMVTNGKSIFICGGDGYDWLFTPAAEVRRYYIPSGEWHGMKGMPHYLWGATAQIIDGKIYIMGGGRALTCTSYNLVYDIQRNLWEEKAELPIARKGLVSGVIDGIIYIACGYQMLAMYNVNPYCYAYNPKTDTWKQCQSPLSNRAYAMSVVVDGFLYVLGGYTPNCQEGECIGMDRYCPKTNWWEVMPDMPRPRIGAVAVAIDSKIFVLCGKDYEGFITIDYYDTKTGEWTITDIPEPAIVNPAVAVVDNKIYLIGGTIETSNFYIEGNRDLYEITYCGMEKKAIIK